MAAETPNSYKDPFWSDLAGRVEAKLELPKGLLVGIVTRGERSNADQVSEAGARTPFQIIPATRKAAVEKWGIDPMLSPENAAEVAGLLLKDSLQRNQGDPALAVAEYHGGTDRSNWGPRTKAYVQRVVGAQPQPVADQSPNTAVDLPPADPTQGGQSTFDRVSAAMKPAGSAIANVYAAYKGGQMSPEQAQAFEADVNAGKVMLPRGATLNQTAASAPPPTGAEANIVKAFNDRLMNPEQQAALLKDVQSGAFKVPQGMSLNIPGTSAGSGIPDSGVGLTGPVADAPAPTLAQRAVGTGEAALTALTGMAGGTVGTAAGTVRGMARQILSGEFGTPQAADAVEKEAADMAASLTYHPRTEQGQNQAEVLGSVMQQVLPVMPLTGELGMAARSAAPVRAAVGDASQAARAVASERVAAPVSEASRAAVDRIKQLTGFSREEARPTAGTQGSAGSAGTDVATLRATTAEQLPVPIRLTEGQATREFGQQRFEGETAKDPNIGAPLRDRFAEQNAQLSQNFERMIDETGAVTPSNIETGRAVNSALTSAAAAKKAEYRSKYRVADKAGELEEPVSLAPLADYLNANRAGRSSAPILGTIADELKVQGIGDGAIADGSLVAKDATLAQAEAIRKAVNKFVKDTDPNDVRVGSEIKGVIDQITEGKGGELYKEARKARQRYSQLFEDNAIVSQLLKTRRGTADRQVALEDVFNKTILNGDREGLGMLRRTLQVAGGEEGAQAWRELQGATLRHLVDEANKGVGTDVAGRTIFSASGLDKAIKALEQGGKLDFILGKKGAQTVRDVNEIAKVVKTLPPGAVNTSNTASVLLLALSEAGATGALTGLPVPAMSLVRAASSYIKDSKTRTRVQAALREPSTTTRRF